MALPSVCSSFSGLVKQTTPSNARGVGLSKPVRVIDEDNAPGSATHGPSRWGSCTALCLLPMKCCPNSSKTSSALTYLDRPSYHIPSPPAPGKKSREVEVLLGAPSSYPKQTLSL